jgi:ABC-type sugar transport system ATPase subunit
MIFQGCVLYPHLTAGENMAFGLVASSGGWSAWIGRRLANLFGTAKSAGRAVAIGENVRRTAQLLGVGHLLDRYPRQLSGGECQRVALGRALVRQPAVFLLDEPWSNVDARARHQLRVELRRVRAELGGAMILVTHDQAEALALGDRVAVLDGGRIHQIGLPAEIVDAPRTRFVAQYIGQPPMNFAAGWLKAREGKLMFESGDWQLELGARTAQLDGAVWLGIRPDAMTAEHISGGEMES